MHEQGRAQQPRGESHGTRSQARDLAKDRKIEHVIKELDGTIGDTNTYENDPPNVPGWAIKTRTW